MHFAFNDGRQTDCCIQRLATDGRQTDIESCGCWTDRNHHGSSCWLRVSSKARPSDANEINAVPYRLRLRDKHRRFPNPTRKTFQCYSNPKAGLGRRGTSIHSMKHASFSFIVFCFHSQKSNDNR